ncbi:hypothetical protein chiPu_0019319 [Chiloscyllium punctatum]|uniref:Uncharacterized protein n=1 Tax=Chiloscyllium punctatum TaxID=137246 RepID=A0A401RRI5_CHIPU|nr:hypothetical protein [Chiloscyllium punctatum]
MPTQYGVSLASKEELIVFIMKATTAMVMPRSSCNKAMRMGKRQPQHLVVTRASDQLTLHEYDACDKESHLPPWGTQQS